MSSNISEETTLQYKYLTSIFTKAFGPECAHQVAGTILPLKDDNNFEEYMHSILDLSKIEHQRLYQDIRFIKFGYQVEKASEEEQEYFRQVIEDKEREIHFRLGGWDEETAASSIDIEERRKKNKKGTKINLSELHKGYLKQGRVPCECQASEHKLINNCIECGRLVCEQEGSGPCFFCDSMVCTPEEQEILSSSSKQASQLYNTLMERKKSEDWKKMIEQRDKLISYDEQFSSRTKIIDEDEDYYDVNNKWLSDRQRKKVKEHLDKEKDRQESLESRLNKSMKITLDVENRKAIQEKDEEYNFRSLSMDDFECSDTEDSSVEHLPKMPDVQELIQAMKLKVEMKGGGVYSPDSSFGTTEEDEEYGRDKAPPILDPMYTSQLDFGQCLSMHQPWASLLVYGIKRHEGRGWETDHRGQLWIASTGKPADPIDIETCEQFYKQYYEGTTIVFPKVYPAGVLLGSVFLQDCVDEEDYIKFYDKRELEGSPYVFVCENPQILPFPLPIKGKPKIYTLDLDIHKTARRALGLKKQRINS